MIKFLKECWKELKKVSWPSYKELEQLIVFFFIGVFLWGTFVFCADQAVKFVQQYVYGWLQKRPS
jgi:preprotein translocase SecE subunit